MASDLRDIFREMVVTNTCSLPFEVIKLLAIIANGIIRKLAYFRPVHHTEISSRVV